MILLYNILFLLGNLIAFPISLVSAISLEKRRATVLKRMSPASQVPRFRCKPIWIQALSVGEVLSSVVLIREIRKKYPESVLVCSVSTLSGYKIANERLRGLTDLIFFFPYDFLWAVRPLIRRVDPLIFLLVETDFWPNFLHEMQRHGTPAILVNGRISPRSFKRYGRVRFFTKQLVSSLSCCCMQTLLDAGRIISLGAARENVEITGNIKFDQPSLSIPDKEISEIKASLGIEAGAKVVLAGSTHQGEEEVLLRCFSRLRERFPDLVLVVVPRDPGRAGRVQYIFRQASIVAVRKTELDRLDVHGGPETVVVDTMGELRRLYAIADVVYVGKSLVNLGGQNPLEPAALKKPIVFGPYMFNFQAVADMLVREEGAIRVEDGDDLFEQLKTLLFDPKRCFAMGERAHEVFIKNQGAVDRVLKVVDRFMPEGTLPD